MESKLIINVSDEENGERIDSFLSGKTEFTRTRIQQLIKERNIMVNGKATKSSYKIEKDDEIAIEVPEAETTEIKPENIDIDIVYEDPYIAVINKQAGLVVHPAHGHCSGTLVNAILYHIKDLSGINGEIRPGIVHRLDKDTSGLIVIAKNDKVHAALTEMFQEKKIRKTYLAILKGKLNKSEGKIVTQIGRDKNDRKKMTVIDDVAKGKNAITNYKVVSQNNLFTLVKVNIETGRTHQIRVHLKSIGHTIVGDELYGKGIDIEKGVKRQFLHAYRVKFTHPATKKEMEIEIPLAEDMKEFLEK